MFLLSILIITYSAQQQPVSSLTTLTCRTFVYTTTSRYQRWRRKWRKDERCLMLGSWERNRLIQLHFRTTQLLYSGRDVVTTAPTRYLQSHVNQLTFAGVLATPLRVFTAIAYSLPIPETKLTVAIKMEEILIPGCETPTVYRVNIW